MSTNKNTACKLLLRVASCVVSTLKNKIKIRGHKLQLEVQQYVNNDKKTSLPYLM